jgi:membrane protein implicated in regulation of membrane protease activity
VDTSPETWRWIWLVAAVTLVAGELAVPGTFILIPYGLSALVAMVLAFAGLHIVYGWLVFVVLGTALFTLFWRMSRNSMRGMEPPKGAGADRLLGATGRVVQAVPADPASSGLVKLAGEEWRAISDDGSLAEGTIVEVTEVRGTRVVVRSAPSEKGIG